MIPPHLSPTVALVTVAEVVDQLVGTSEIAERLDLSHPANVHTWRNRGIGFPEPVAIRSGTMLWWWPDVERWARETGRLDEHGNRVVPPKPRRKMPDA